MSMEEWPDDHLDNLFRKSAEEYDVPFNADDWTDMSRRLAEHDRQMLFDRVSRWGGVYALLILLLGGLGWLTSDKETTASRQQISTLIIPGRQDAVRLVRTVQANRSNTPTQPVEERELNRRITPGNKGAAIQGELAKQQRVGSTTGPAGQLTTSKGSQSVKQIGRLPDQSVDASIGSGSRFRPARREKQLAADSERPVSSPALGRDRELVVAKSIQGAAKPDGLAENAENHLAAKAPEQPTGTYPAPGNRIAENTVGDQPTLAVKSAGLTESTLAESGIEGQWLPALTPAMSLSNVIQQVRPVVEPTLSGMSVVTSVRATVPHLSRLSVLLFASPDLSNIGLRNFDRPGSNAGLTVQYQITDRLSVNTGAMYSTKRYQTYGSEYVWPAYTKVAVRPEVIAGVCKMIDVPLNLRYDWLLRPRGDGRAPARWFASAGLTSYFIKHEVYTYEYANPDDPKVKAQPQGWDNQRAGRPGGTFGFSNINISVGYERPITHRLSWQIEPFMKVPLKQVGYFKIKLLSTGAFVGLRYRL